MARNASPPSQIVAATVAGLGNRLWRARTYSLERGYRGDSPVATSPSSSSVVVIESVVMASPQRSSMTDARIDDGVQEVDDEVDEDDGQREHGGAGLQHQKIAGLRADHEQAAHAGHAEDH